MTNALLVAVMFGLQATTEPNSSRFRSDFHNRGIGSLSVPPLKIPSLMQTRDHKKGKSILSQQSFHDAEPFHIERFSAHRLPRPTVPVRRVALIAFLAVQVGMNPRTFRAFVLLSRFVRPIPVALAVPPQADEGECESRRRLGGGE